MKSITKLCCLVFSALPFAFAGCTEATSDGAENSEVGEVSLALTTVPAGVRCIQIVAKGSTSVTKSFTVTAGSTGVNALALGALPVGSVVISGQGYNAACSSISGQTPTWIAENFTITVQSGVISSPAITFRPNNAVTATANFVGNVVEVASNEYVIDVLYSDGTVRGSGDQAVLGLGQLTTFTALSSLTDVASLALSAYDFGCVRLKSGTVSCFGANNVGQLGNGTTTPSTTPVAVARLTNVVQLSAGGCHACALKSDGSVWCWGSNESGQVGNGSTTNATLPLQVMTGASNVTAGWGSTCALKNGSVWCWGNNNYGQLGLGHTLSAIASPTLLGDGRSGTNPTITGISQIVLGAIHTCALRGDGGVFCWGDNGSGQLGYDNTLPLLAPSETPVLAGAQQLSATSHGTCARLKDGHVMCWGADDLGQVGDGTGSFHGILRPTPVLSDATFTSIYQGSAHTVCGAGADSKVYCWGNNASNQFANGGLSSVFVPTALGI